MKRSFVVMEVNHFTAKGVHYLLLYKEVFNELLNARCEIAVFVQWLQLYVTFNIHRLVINRVVP